jgi:hypothetical protein
MLRLFVGNGVRPWKEKKERTQSKLSFLYPRRATHYMEQTRTVLPWVNCNLERACSSDFEKAVGIHSYTTRPTTG